MKRTRTENEWRTLVQDLEGSGASTRDFAERHGLNRRTVVWWRSYFRRRDREAKRSAPVVQFATVQRSVARASARSETGVTGLAIFSGGVRIGVQPGFDPETLTALLDVLDARHEGRR
ncbi:MAG: hypothetical protein IT379_01860 [Deltaproteobacteria bacterium]|nr:hypothetical protein [Deltaproteobacteria bacterium]